MIELYPEVRLVHIVAVVASGGLFLLRGLALNLGFAWPRAAPLRYLSYSVDTLLLAAAILLTTLVEQYPFLHAWLTVKVLLLVAYIALGILAFRQGRPRAVRLGCWLAALAVYGFIVSVARAHHPLGLFSGLAG
ncbi:MAG: SirB2 family protein [Tistlia sp.]|uniref:SirB2 family protein n=1 Tax=Tistlia sp. TaxID=3057121 RepID=UPI0034A34EE7